MTMTSSFRRIGLTALVLTLVGPGLARAEQIIGLTTSNQLVIFDSATPGTITGTSTITGLVGGETLVGIDRRPQALGPGVAAPGPNNNQLYGIGVNFTTGAASIYTLNETNGAATLRASLTADPADTVAPTPFTTVTGGFFGIDFNPTVDRLRLTSDSGQNLRINVDNGLVQLDVPLAYQPGDPNVGRTPVEASVAYSNNFGGATTTVLRGVDVSNPDLLVIHSNPNGGLLQTSLLTGINSDGRSGYDVSGLTGTPFFTFTPPGGTTSSLYTITGGAFTLVGAIGSAPLIGIALNVGVPVPEPASLVLLGVGTIGLLAVARRRRARVA